MHTSSDSSSTAGDSPHPQREPLAVIGIGCRLPGDIDSPTSFWEKLLDGFDAICDVPEDRWIHSRFHDTNPEKYGCIRNAKGGFIKHVDQFDGEFFGYFPAAAQRIDPQQRLLLEVTHEAMEDAGLRRDQLDGSRTAVFIGSFMYDYLCMQAASDMRDEIGTHTAMGTAICSLSNRISYDFNLTGPSVSLDTACSSSLMALHLACRSVWSGEAEMAITGGVNLMLRPETSIMMSKGGFLNPDQYCKAFDASANGYVRGEGVGVVILKPLARAIADRDSIYACVRGTAANQDGHVAEGFTVPNVFSQVSLLETVYREANIDPSTVDYVEAHGTGTPVGDPVETSALGSVMGFERSEQQRNLIIGSVKTNLGHLEGASGIAGFIKAVLTVQHGEVPPNLHFKNPNPAIPWEHYRLEVPTERTPLQRVGDRQLTVGVNSFGAGGANAHVVLQEFNDATPCPEKPAHTNGRVSAPATLYMLSAVHRESLRSLALKHADFLSRTEHSLEDVAYSTFGRRSHYPHLVAVAGESAKEIESRLRRFADGQADSETMTAKITHKAAPKLAFVFSGQGGQWPQMGLKLMRREHVFRQSMEEIDAVFRDLSGWSLLEELRKEQDQSRLNHTVIVQPAIMAIQISLVRLYERYGIRPAGVVGHSIGEVAAGFASRALTLRQAVEVIYHRSQAQSRAAGKGGMLAVGLSLEDARALIKDYDGVSIGAVNGPEMLTLSGDNAPLAEVARSLEVRGVFNRPVNVEVAYHSHHMEPIKDIMLDSLAHSQGRRSSIPLYSTVSGDLNNGGELNAAYWYLNVRRPVLFTDALRSMVRDDFDTFVEIGPNPVLVRGAEAMFGTLDADAMIAPSMTRKAPEETVFLQSLACLAARGLEPSAAVLFGEDHRYVPAIPKNVWQRRRHWFETPAAAENRLGPYQHPFLKRKTQMATEEGMVVWDASLDVQKFPYLHDHQVDGEIVFPATGHVELAWAVASEQFRHESFFLENIHLESPLILPDKSNHPLDVRLEIVSGEGDYRICSRPMETKANGDTPWSGHSTGRINSTHDQFDETKVHLSDLRSLFEDNDELSIDDFYKTVNASGLEYGERFRCIQQLWRKDDAILARLELPLTLEHESHRIEIHPALLDACLHAVFAEVQRGSNPHRVFLPFRIGRVRIDRKPSRHVWSHVRVSRSDDSEICLDATVFDNDGQLVAELLNITCRRLSGSGSNLSDSLYDGCYEYCWTPSPRDPAHHVRNSDYTTAALISPATTSPASEQHLANLAVGLEQAGVRPMRIAASAEASFEDLLADIPLDRRTLIVFTTGLSEHRAGWQGLSECPYVPSLLGLAQTLHRSEGVPRLFVVTNGAVDVDGEQQIDLGQSVLHGMVRVINNECPSVTISTIDLSPEITPSDMESLLQECLHDRRDCDESEIGLRGTQRYLRQLIPVEPELAEQTASTLEDGFGGPYRAEVNVPGALDQIVFRKIPPADLRENEVEIAVRAAALNFKDVINAMGVLPHHAVAGGLTADRLGLEVAGRVLKCGSLVEHVRVGDEVIARVSEGFCGRVITRGDYVVRRPNPLSTEQAAAVPLVYITAWHSLCYLARMEAGDTVLIHSAAGGVGGAAVRLAQRAGATVIATAGTKEKREYLRGMGIKDVFDSRSLDFYNRVMEATGGRGVDIVLNSLTGRFIAQGIKCLAPFGRFVEIGKSDIYRNSKLNLARLGENISYFVVDVDRLAVQQPKLHRQAITEVAAMFERGELPPHEITEFPISKLPDALRFMTRSAYKGKIVMNMQRDSVHTLPARRIAFRTDRSYLISGGASGLGLQVARWMADRGARHLVLLSRSGCKREQDEAVVDAIRDMGVAVMVARTDVTDSRAVHDLLDRIQREWPPLAGVIHGAAILDDASIPNMNMQRFEGVFNPKAQGAWNLHEATIASGADLDFFVMLSSISSVLGLYGQLNYAAANYFQDSLAHFRRLQGLRATSVNLGVLGQYAGMSNADDQGVIGLLESQGMYVMPLAEVLAKLEVAMIQGPSERMTARIDWPWFRLAYRHLVRDSRLIDLISDAALASSVRPSGSGLRSDLAELEQEQRPPRLEQELAMRLARILDSSPDKLDVSTSIDSFGLDSLMLTEFQVAIMRALDINVPLIKLLKGPSIESLATELLQQLDDDRNTDTGLNDMVNQEAADFSWADLDGVQVISPWLVRGNGDSDAPARLLCFHSMGVGASLFTQFLDSPPSGFDILAVQTPGREDRADEPLIEKMDDLVDQVVQRVQPYCDRPLVIWGHSFGGIVGWEVARRLRERQICEPAHFIVTGTAGPHLMFKWQSREVLLKAMVVDNSPEYLISLSRYVDDAEFIKSILPLMRKDFPLLKGYRFQTTTPLACPITAFAARQDDFVYTDEIREWSQHTLAEFELVEVDGDHWFLSRNRTKIIETLENIAAKLKQESSEHHARLPVT